MQKDLLNHGGCKRICLIGGGGGAHLIKYFSISYKFDRRNGIFNQNYLFITCRTVKAFLWII